MGHLPATVVSPFPFVATPSLFPTSPSLLPPQLPAGPSYDESLRSHFRLVLLLFLPLPAAYFEALVTACVLFRVL